VTARERQRTMADDLTLKQSLFIEAYLGECAGNGVAAARSAGYAGNDNTLHVVAHENLRKPAIAARVGERLAQAMMGADECMAEISAIARQPLCDTVKVKRNGRDEVLDAHLDPMAKLRALELVGNYHGIFKNRSDLPTEDHVVRVLEYINPNKPMQIEGTTTPREREVSITTGEEKQKIDK